MKLFAHLERDDQAHVSIQLSAEEYGDLRKWMHTKEGELVALLHGVKLLKRGFGWFRMEASNTTRAIEKIKTSMAVFTKWHRDFVNRRNQELRLLLAKSAPEAKVTSFSTVTRAFTVKTPQGETEVGIHRNKWKPGTSERGSRDASTLQPSKPPVDPNRLFALTQKFGARR